MNDRIFSDLLSSVNLPETVSPFAVAVPPERYLSEKDKEAQVAAP